MITNEKSSTSDLKGAPRKNLRSKSVGLNNDRKKIYSILFLILLLGFSIRIYHLDQNQSTDEAISFLSSQKSPFEVIKENNYNPLKIVSGWEPMYPPIYFIILHYSGANELGDVKDYIQKIFSAGDARDIDEKPDTKIFKLRFPFVILGTLSILLIFKVGETLFDKKTGLIAAFFLSTSSYHLVYSQIARPYVIFSFLTLLTIFFFYQCLKKNSRNYWVGFILSTIMSFYTHYYTVFIIFTEIVFLSLIFLIKNLKSSLLSLNINEKTFRNLLLSWFVIVILSSPLIFYILNFTFGTGNEGWNVNPNTFNYLVYPYLTANLEAFNKLIANLIRISTIFSVYIVQWIILYPYKIQYLTIPAAIVQFFAFILYITRPILQNRSKKIEMLEPYMLLLLFISIPNIAILVTMTYSTIFEPRLYYAVFPLYLLVISRGLEKIDNKRILITLMAIITLINIPAIYNWFFTIQRIQ
jgi:uncharacterized membrane protein